MEALLLTCKQVSIAMTSEGTRALAEQLGTERWRPLAELIRNHLTELSVDDLVHLVKLSTILDNGRAGPLGEGSTSNVHVLLTELSRRSPTLAEEMTIWAFHTAKNPYIPFGTRNRARDIADSVSSYRAMERHRDEENQLADSARSGRAAERKEARAIVHTARISAQQDALNARDAYIANLESQSPSERLTKIAVDVSHPVTYFPDRFADSTAALSLDSEMRRLLRRRLASVRKGAWMRLRRLLDELAEL